MDTLLIYLLLCYICWNPIYLGISLIYCNRKGDCKDNLHGRESCLIRTASCFSYLRKGNLSVHSVDLNRGNVWIATDRVFFKVMLTFYILANSQISFLICDQESKKDNKEEKLTVEY